MTPEELRRWSAELVGWKLMTHKEAGFTSDDTTRAWFRPDGVFEDGSQWWSFRCWDDQLMEDWTPDLDTAPAWQIKAVIEAMQKKGYFLQLEDEGLISEEWCANYGFHAIYSTNLWLAILAAAYEVWKAGKGDNDHAG